MSEKRITRLNKTDLRAIEFEVQQQLGPEPTVDQLLTEGYRESAWLHSALETIRAGGRIITLLLAELIQAGAALIIGVVFALLEYWRVKNGALALGEVSDQAGLIAFAVVTANAIVPIYSLRELRGQASHTVTRATARGYWESFTRRLFGQPQTEQVAWSHNPALTIAAAVITWSTIALAVYDLVAPLLTSILEGTATRPALILVIELLMGLGLSLAGVFFLQAASHEIGVRILTDQPQRLVDLVEQRRAERVQRETRIRQDVRARYMAAKLAEQERKAANPTQPGTIPATNGHHSATVSRPGGNPGTSQTD
jgi:hypothetical protein